MLLFIALLNRMETLLCYSNTSHVIVYRTGGQPGRPGLLFKYISCYCLSTGMILVTTSDIYSNTSHVIVYQYSPPECPANSIIQIHLMLLFISHFCGFFRVIILHSSALYSLFTLFYQPLPYYCTSLSISSYFLLFSLLVKTLQLIFTW